MRRILLPMLVPLIHPPLHSLLLDSSIKMNDFVLVKFKGRALDIMCKVNPECIKLIWKENGQNVMYLQLAKALYGCLKLVSLWYNLFRSTLEDMGFVFNKYDPCVANKMTNGNNSPSGSGLTSML